MGIVSPDELGLDPDDPARRRHEQEDRFEAKNRIALDQLTGGALTKERPAPAEPKPYSGPSLSAIDAELHNMEVSGNISAASIARERQLAQLRNRAYQAATPEQRRAASFEAERHRKGR